MKEKVTFYVERKPNDILQGLGWIKVDLEAAKRFKIPHKYTDTIEILTPKPYCCPIDPEDKRQYFQFEYRPYDRIYLPSSKGSSKKFSLQLPDEVVTLFVQKSLTIEAVREWVKTWATSEAKLITSGKQSITLDGESTTKNAFVYFVLNRDSKAIKIGMAKDVQKRLKSLQTSNPIILELLHTIGLNSIEDAQKLEAYLHQKFSHLNMNGEWFQANDELKQYIKNSPKFYSQLPNISTHKPYRSIPISEL